jgi:hypothetical protein
MGPMSLVEIQKAVDALSAEELSKLADDIARHDKLIWDEQIERDFSRGGRHAGAIERIDSEIDADKFTQETTNIQVCP